jgi:hypothetical protein
MYRKLISHLDDRLFHFRCNPVLYTGVPSAFLHQPLKAMLVIRLLNIIEMLSGKAVDLTGLGNVPEILT